MIIKWIIICKGPGSAAQSECKSCISCPPSKSCTSIPQPSLVLQIPEVICICRYEYHPSPPPPNCQAGLGTSGLEAESDPGECQEVRVWSHSGQREVTVFCTRVSWGDWNSGSES